MIDRLNKTVAKQTAWEIDFLFRKTVRNKLHRQCNLVFYFQIVPLSVNLIVNNNNKTRRHSKITNSSLSTMLFIALQAWSLINFVCEPFSVMGNAEWNGSAPEVPRFVELIHRDVPHTCVVVGQKIRN